MERIEAMKRERRGISPTPPPPQCWAGNRIQSAFLSSNMRPFDYHVLLLLLFFVVVIVDSSLSSIDNSLFEALRSDDVIAASAALKDGANINALSPQGGQTPLMQSVLHGRVDMVRWCLENGADTTIAEKDGYTPMHGAAFQGHAPIAKLLLEHGVALRDVHSDGFEPASE
jgi:ankyrin repeat protein